LCKRYLQREVVNGRDARDVGQELRIESCGVRVNQSFDTRDKMSRNDGVAIGPFRAVAQMERVSQSVVRNVPACGCGRYQFAVGRIADEPFTQVA